MREERGLHLTGRRYPGHGRSRPEYRYAGATGPPDDPPPKDERPSLLNQIPW
jgi:hypothetical protein